MHSKFVAVDSAVMFYPDFNRKFASATICVGWNLCRYKLNTNQCIEFNKHDLKLNVIFWNWVYLLSNYILPTWKFILFSNYFLNSKNTKWNVSLQNADLLFTFQFQFSMAQPLHHLHLYHMCHNVSHTSILQASWEMQNSCADGIFKVNQRAKI